MENETWSFGDKRRLKPDLAAGTGIPPAECGSLLAFPRYVMCSAGPVVRVMVMGRKGVLQRPFVRLN